MVIDCDVFAMKRSSPGISMKTQDNVRPVLRSEAGSARAAKLAEGVRAYWYLRECAWLPAGDSRPPAV